MKHPNVVSLLSVTASCQYMTDFREKSILLDGVSGTFSNANAKVKEDSEGKLQLHSLYLLCTLLQLLSNQEQAQEQPWGIN